MDEADAFEEALLGEPRARGAESAAVARANRVAGQARRRRAEAGDVLERLRLEVYLFFMHKHSTQHKHGTVPAQRSPRA